ncbi:hypothetical protein ACRDU6_20470 [Mycolicibacterium sp. ELW1]|uniref:hypothetical protein n=1 Tax=Mycobacteriaceae TaxID=1762 RepID=UPI0011EF2196|nr:hypothetical protein [Mycobacterium sp. ELW1]QEN14738.1 hypothetical protein D3H54_17010 [Mycobacterium sp. ELW1]
MDRPKPRWIPDRLWPWLGNRWVQAVLVIALFAILGVVFMMTSDRKDTAYWAGYTDGQRWVDAGGYQAHEESIAAYCAGQAAHHAASYQRGCVDGAHNAMH